MNKIYKYNIPLPTLVREWRLPLYNNSIVRHVGEQNGQVYIWVEIDEDFMFDIKERTFFIVGTGHYIDNNSDFIGTVQMKNGLVWHVYEKI